ncbi:MAG: esterase family protein [Lentisphaerae bacterium]|nr:esterase family protein [Lentisphaerota bacterium]
MRKFKAITVLLLFSISSALAATVGTISISSSKMGRDIPATLILPDSYSDTPQRFPVLYLLHGAGDSYAGWNANSDIAGLSDEYGIIVVCPDGGKTSWYFDSPIDPTYQYETFVAIECVTYIDRSYRTKAHRDSRAICGLSMGGHGALFLAIRHRDVFSVAVALSGGVDIRPFRNNWNIKDQLGSIESHKEIWETHTVINVANDLHDGELAISLDCGDQDFFLKVNRALHAQLLEAGITHRYIEMPGAHNWVYWKEAIKRQMRFIDNHFTEHNSVESYRLQSNESQ